MRAAQFGVRTDGDGPLATGVTVGAESDCTASPWIGARTRGECAETRAPSARRTTAGGRVRRSAAPLSSARRNARESVVSAGADSGTFGLHAGSRKGDDVAEVGQLVRAAAEGDQAAWDQLVARFNGLVWSVVRAHRLAGAEAADVTQTTWLRAVEHLDHLRDPDHLGAWLATTARRESLRAIRLGSRRALGGEDLSAVPAPDAPVDIGLLESERDSALWDAFVQLDERCQLLLRMLIADPPATYEEIMAALDMPIGSIGPTRGRCLERLRKHAEAAGISRDWEGS
jgi:RNA polymerase sigma factor (sigma-70 family)